MFSYLKRKIRKLFKWKQEEVDEFDWEKYPETYKKELADIAKFCTQTLNRNDYVYKNRELIINGDILPLHPNHKLLYETILQLSPSSVIELGCGGGDHFKNINTLAPEIKLYGRDISTDQIKLLKERHPELSVEIEQLDITLPHPFNAPTVDIAFTQAVIMHIHTGKSHLVALSNLFRYANKQVILMENWSRHDFKQDIEFLFAKGMIPWKRMYMYYREFIDFERSHLMVVSATPLPEYKPLTDYSILSKPLD